MQLNHGDGLDLKITARVTQPCGKKPSAHHSSRVVATWLLAIAISTTFGFLLLSITHEATASSSSVPSHQQRNGKSPKKRSVVEIVRRDFPRWRGQELRKVLRQVSMRKPARGNKFLKEGLSAHEGGAHNGHTIRRHVSVSAKHLTARIEHLKQRSADTKQSVNKNHAELKMEHISSFTSLREANRLVEKTLTHPQNMGQLARWAKNKSNRGLEKKESRQTLELTLKDVGSVTGLAMDPKTKRLVEARGVRVIVQRGNSKRGWSIKTAYPIAKSGK